MLVDGEGRKGGMRLQLMGIWSEPWGPGRSQLLPSGPWGRAPFGDPLNSFAVDLVGLPEEGAEGLGKVGRPSRCLRGLPLLGHLMFPSRLMAHLIGHLIILTSPSLPFLGDWGTPLGDEVPLSRRHGDILISHREQRCPL